MNYLIAIPLGIAVGLLAGMFGVGGGILIVPALLALGVEQHAAIGTSLLALIPGAVTGTWRQSRYGNVRWRAAAILGVAAAASAQGGVAIAEALPSHVLRRLFAVLLLLVAAQIVWRARRR